MKITKDYLRKLIREGLEEMDAPQTPQASQVTEAAGKQLFLVFFRDYEDTYVAGIYDDKSVAEKVAAKMAKTSGMPWRAMALKLNGKPDETLLM